MFGQRLHQPAGFLGSALLCKTLAHTVERVSKARILHRLHQIIDGLRLERADCVIGIGRDKNEQRRFDLHQPLHNRKPVEAGHLDVEEHQIGLVGLDRADCFAPVRAGIDDFDIVMRLQPQLHALNGEFFVIDEDRSYGHAASKARVSTTIGISTVTTKPPSGALPLSKRWSGP